METDPTKPIDDIQKDIPGLTDLYIEIGTSKYKLSKELLSRYFLLGIKSGYESSKSILTIGEPHYVAEAQFSLFQGLENFFADNPELIKKTIFLAEGFPADQPISVKKLIEADLHPSDELIRETLNSFLITGYMAYEWKHQHGITIIGTENQELYELSKEFATWCVEDPKASLAYVGIKEANGTVRMISVPVEVGWNFAVNARNKAIATTLINQTRKYENPILFVGTGHLNTKQNDDNFAIVKNIAETAVDPKTIFGKHLKSIDRKSLENHSIHYYLQQEKIGYFAIEPFGLQSKREEMVYQRLFQAQQNGQFKAQSGVNYEGYLNWLLSQKRSKPGKITTVTPDPDAAAEFVRRFKEQQKQESEQNGGVIYEAKPEHDTKYDWFITSPEEERVKIKEKYGVDSIWELGPSSRGKAYEYMRGAEPANNLKHVDDIRYDARTVTGMKTIELRDPTYQDIGGLESRVRGCIDELSGYQGGEWKKRTFTRSIDFDDVYLEIGIPAETATQEQVEKLLEMQEYAQTKNVTLVINEVP